MSDSDMRHAHTGLVDGDSKSMPMRDQVNVTDTYGADVGQGAKNQLGKITSATKSDAPDYGCSCTNPSPTV